MKKEEKETAKTKIELAMRIGRSTPTLAKYQKNGLKLRKDGKGRYLVQPVRDWIDKNVRFKSDSAPYKMDAQLIKDYDQTKRNKEIEEMNLEDLRRELLIAQTKERVAAANYKSMQVEMQKGAWVSADRVKERDTERIAIVRQALLALPRRLAQELHEMPAHRIERHCNKVFREILDRFSKA